MATKYKYDKDTDYAALMEQAARCGDNAAAAVYEQQRNAKIRGEGMAGQEQTSDYAQYLPIEDVPDYDDTHRREAEALLTGRGTADRREQIDRMLDALLGEQFDYDPASDKLYAAYRQQYERQAELAAENALGKAAALTGGQASTAAVAAAQQAGGSLHPVLLEQFLVSTACLRPDALADIGQRDAVTAGHIGEAGLTVILGDLIQSRLHQLFAADGRAVGFQREFLDAHRYPPLRRSRGQGGCRSRAALRSHKRPSVGRLLLIIRRIRAGNCIRQEKTPKFFRRGFDAHQRPSRERRLNSSVRPRSLTLAL